MAVCVCVQGEGQGGLGGEYDNDLHVFPSTEDNSDAEVRAILCDMIYIVFMCACVYMYNIYNIS